MTSVPSYSPEVLLKIYQIAAKIRTVDSGVRSIIRSGGLAIAMHPPTGQEIIAAATGAVLTKEDYLVTIYRGMHDQLAKGMPIDLLVAEYFGRATGACKGKGGPMHITHPESGVMVTSGVVGSGMPIATGLAWASQLKGDGRVTVTCFGDGASNIGAFHEALNLAAVWKLPVIFLCQNNRYAECTTYEDATGSKTVAERAVAYGENMAGVSVDGNDPEAMYEAIRAAVARARAGDGPTLLEAHTFRLSGHYFGDPSPYIPKEEMAEAMANDPVTLTRAAVLASGAATEAELVAMQAKLDAEFAAAVEFAQNSPTPDLSEVTTDIYGVA